MKGICDVFKIIVNNISIESIINFFEYLYEIRNKVQKENTYSDDDDDNNDNNEYKDWIKE